MTLYCGRSLLMHLLRDYSNNLVIDISFFADLSIAELIFGLPFDHYELLDET